MACTSKGRAYEKDRFYNILFPLWFFLFIPSTWLFLDHIPWKRRD